MEYFYLSHTSFFKKMIIKIIFSKTKFGNKTSTKLRISYYPFQKKFILGNTKKDEENLPSLM